MRPRPRGPSDDRSRAGTAAPGLVRGRGRRRPRPPRSVCARASPTIPVTMPAPLRPLSGRRRFTLLAVAALIVVGGALAAGSGFLLVTPVVTPAPSPAAIAPGSPSPAETGLETPAPTAHLHDGTVIAFMRNVEQGPRLLPEAQLPDAAAVDRRHGRAWRSRAAGRRRGQPDPPGLVARRDSPAVLGRDQAVPDRPGRWPATAGRHRLRAAVTDDAALLPVRCARSRSRATAAASSSSGPPPMRPGRSVRGRSRRWTSRAVGCPS